MFNLWDIKLKVLSYLLLLLTKESLQNECYKKYLWSNFQDAVGKFNSPFYLAAASDLKSKILENHLGEEAATMVVSPFWLEMLLITLSLGVNGQTLREINEGTYYDHTKEDKMEMLQYFKDNMINADPNMKLEVINMMFLDTGLKVKDSFQDFATSTFNMTFDYITFTNVTDTRKTLNQKITRRTRRKMLDVFDDNDLKPDDTSIILVSSIYFKNKWLYPATVLNGTYDFKFNVTERVFKVRMFRLNGLMLFAHLPDYDAKVVEIPYFTEGLSMLVFLPNTLDGLLPMEKNLLKHEDILKYSKQMMKETPVAVSLPIYAAEMNVILPSKLQKLNISRMFENNSEMGDLVENANVTITNAVQRIKFWADAGRGAFKDTGDEELPLPFELMFADHPFFFIVKMNETSFLMGHFIV